MSAQQILTQTQQSKATEVDNKLYQMVSTHVLYSDFLVGCPINHWEMQHALIMQDILCTNNCDLIEHIKDKIWGKLYPDKKCRDKTTSLDTLLRNLKKHQQIEDDNECIESVMYWSEVEW